MLAQKRIAIYISFITRIWRGIAEHGSQIATDKPLCDSRHSCNSTNLPCKTPTHSVFTQLVNAMQVHGRVSQLIHWGLHWDCKAYHQQVTNYPVQVALPQSRTACCRRWLYKSLYENITACRWPGMMPASSRGPPYSWSCRLAWSCRHNNASANCSWKFHQGQHGQWCNDNLKPLHVSCVYGMWQWFWYCAMKWKQFYNLTRHFMCVQRDPSCRVRVDFNQLTNLLVIWHWSSEVALVHCSYIDNIL